MMHFTIWYIPFSRYYILIICRYYSTIVPNNSISFLNDSCIPIKKLTEGFFLNVSIERGQRASAKTVSQYKLYLNPQPPYPSSDSVGHAISFTVLSF